MLEQCLFPFLLLVGETETYQKILLNASDAMLWICRWAGKGRPGSICFFGDRGSVALTGPSIFIFLA